MSMETGNFIGFIEWLILKQMNYDKTHAVPTRIVGSAGPFDFSGVAAPAAVPITIKIDGNAAVTMLIDLTGVGDLSAVTVDELVILLTAAGFADIAFSKEGAPGPGIAATNFLKVAYNGTDTCNYLQVYGELAEIVLIGQGQGVRFLVTDAIKEFRWSPKYKEPEELKNNNAAGQEVTVYTNRLRQGCTGSWIDIDYNKWCKHIVENGQYDTTTKQYIAPTQETEPILFTVEAFLRKYGNGTNHEPDIDKMFRTLVYQCMGSLGETAGARGLTDNTISFTATSYKDELGINNGDTVEDEYTIPQYEALDIENLNTL